MSDAPKGIAMGSAEAAADALRGYAQAEEDYQMLPISQFRKKYRLAHTNDSAGFLKSLRRAAMSIAPARQDAQAPAPDQDGFAVGHAETITKVVNFVLAGCGGELSDAADRQAVATAIMNLAPPAEPAAPAPSGVAGDVATSDEAAVAETCSTLRFVAGTGYVNEYYGNRLSDAAQMLDRMRRDRDEARAEAARLRTEIEEALQLTEGCSTLKDLAASFIEASATRAMAMKATETFYASQKQDWNVNDRAADKAWINHCRAIADLAKHLGEPAAPPAPAAAREADLDQRLLLGMRFALSTIQSGPGTEVERDKPAAEKLRAALARLSGSRADGQS